MSAFELKRVAGQGGVDWVHRDSGTVWARCYPYFDLWPIRKVPTHWVIWLWPKSKLYWITSLFKTTRYCKLTN